MEFVLLMDHLAIEQHVVYVLQIILENIVKYHYHLSRLVCNNLVDLMVLVLKHRIRPTIVFVQMV